MGDEHPSHKPPAPGEIDRAPHVYYQTVEEDDEDQEHDYVEPDLETTEYEEMHLP